MQCSASDSVGLIFTRSHRSTLLIATPTTTPSLVKTSLKEIERNVEPIPYHLLAIMALFSNAPSQTWLKYHWVKRSEVNKTSDPADDKLLEQRKAVHDEDINLLVNI